MLLHVLGSGTCLLSSRRSSPAYLVETGAGGLMLDLGQGAWRRFLETGRDPAGVRAVLLSHHHIDHLGDLLPLLFALNYDPAMNARAHITLVCHSGVSQVLEGLAGVFGEWVEPGADNLGKVFLEPGACLEIAGVKISAQAARHLPTSLAFRLEEGGKRLVYLGDSQASPELVEFCAGADLIIAHACGSPDRSRFKHISPAQAGRLAAEAGAQGLLLSHFYDAGDSGLALALAQKEFDKGEILVAEDHLEVEI